MRKYWRSCRGISLLETVMAMVLGALILAPLMLGFNLFLKGWDEDNNQNELLQHARVAMHRITSELRYAAVVKNHTNVDILEFYTRTLVDDDWQAEGVKYWGQDSGAGSYLLYRGVDDGGGYVAYPIAGSWGDPATDVNLLSFGVKYFKLVGSSLEDATTGDPDFLVDVVEVSLDLARGADTLSLTSRVKLRNR